MVVKQNKDKHTVIPPIPQVNTFPVYTDPFGSYTGLSLDLEEPVQDADDL